MSLSETLTATGQTKPKATISPTGDRVLHALTFGSAVLVLLVLGGVFVSLIHGSLPALRTFGFSFLASQTWNPASDPPVFGAAAAIYGTLLTSAIALVIAVPVGLGISVFLTELCPAWLARPIAIAIELLAGIPSIIYGIWGLFVLAPFLQKYVQPYILDVFHNKYYTVPGLDKLFAGPFYGIGVFAASIILAIMVLPFISSVTRDVFETVPHVLKEAAFGLGCTKWEVVRRVVIPHTRAGVIGAIMLSLGRALGETMAVTFVIGNAHKIAASIMAPGTTISATIANEFTEATDEIYTSSLIALGLILFIVTFIVLAAARFMLYRMEKQGK